MRYTAMFAIMKMPNLTPKSIKMRELHRGFELCIPVGSFIPTIPGMQESLAQ
jgi:hypothetical protein